ncbi:MAG: ABC transporter substrate-binding protein [Betaproteobacteria bacterium]|nr:ABC transporter substrate-binding protein [Betaproteobacteria bacterium]
MPAKVEARQSEELVVGQVVELSGLGREFSRDFVAGAKTYFDHVNATGLLPGKRIKHVVKDDGGNPDETLTRTRELLKDDKADVLFGYVGDSGINMLLSNELFQKSGVAFFGAATGLNPARNVDNVYFLRASYAAEAETVIEQFRLLGVSRFGIVTTQSEFGAAIRKEIESVIRQKKLELVRGVETTNDPKQIEGAATRMAGGQRPQVILMLGDSVAVALFVKAYRPLDPGISLVGLSIAQHDTILQIIGPKLAHGTMLTQVVPDLNSKDLPVAIEHLALMRKYRDESPTAASFEGFIAAKTLIEVLRKSGADASRAGVLAALKRSPKLNVGGVRFEFVGGNIRGANYADIVLLRKDGKLIR